MKKYTKDILLKTNDEQKEFLNKLFISYAWVYNKFLDERKRQFSNNGEFEDYDCQYEKLVELSNGNEFYWINDKTIDFLSTSLIELEQKCSYYIKHKERLPNHRKPKTFNIKTKKCELKKGILYSEFFKGGVDINDNLDSSYTIDSLVVYVKDKELYARLTMHKEKIDKSIDAAYSQLRRTIAILKGYDPLDIGWTNTKKKIKEIRFRIARYEEQK